MKRLGEINMGPLGRQYCFEGRAETPEAAEEARWQLRELCARQGVVAYQVGRLGCSVWLAIQRNDWPARLIAQRIWGWVTWGDLEGRVSRRPMRQPPVPAAPPAIRRRKPTSTANMPVVQLKDVDLS